MIPDCQKHEKVLHRVVAVYICHQSVFDLMDWFIDLLYSGGRCYLSYRIN